jgi:ATP-dependent RNA helicase DeaD
MLRYRLEVGREHGVMPKHIVGAIANEAGLDSRQIGRIELYDEYSTVELPEEMPDDVFRHLQNVWVCNRKFNLRLAEQGGQMERPHTERPYNNATKPRPFTKKPGKRIFTRKSEE